MIRIFACTITALLFTAALPSAQAPAGTPGTVTLSRADYDRLLDLASARPRGADTAPVAAALTRADMRVRADGASARASVRLDGEAFRPGVSKVTLITNATLLDARMDNRSLPVVAEGASHVALVTGPAVFSAS